jgi:hypothetical protein
MPVRTIFKILLGLTILEYTAFGKEPEIQIKDGRVSITAENVPLGRLLGLLDRAMGMQSVVKPELAGRSINVQFTDLAFEDAIRKIFQGQPLNYIVIAGKGIQVTELAQSAPVNSAPRTAYDTPPQQNNPFVTLPPPLQPGVPAANAPVNPQQQQQQPAVTIFGSRPDANPGQNPAYTPPGNTLPGGAALSNNPALNLTPPVVNQQPPNAQPQGGGLPVGAPAPMPAQPVPAAPQPLPGAPR